jgi:O-antigen ligase
MPLPDSPAFHLPPPTLPRRGMRGGLQRAAHAAASAAVPTDGTAPDGRRQQQRPAERLLSSYWAGAWKVAALVTAVLVIRLAEVVPRLSLVRPTVLVLLIAFLMHSSRSRPAAWRRVWQDGQLRRALGYVAVALATVPFALWKIPAISAVQGMVFDVGLIVILLLCPPTLLTVDRLLTAFPLLTSVYAVATIAAGRVVEGDRVTTSGMYDPNDLGALFCIALPMALALLLRAGLLKKALGLVCAAVLAYGIIRTGSRGGMLGMAAGVLTLLLGFNIRRFVPAAVALAIASPLIWANAPETFRRRATSIFELESDYNTTSSSGRMYIWGRGLTFFAANPLIGVGPGSFETRLGQDFREQGTTGAWHTAHNTWIQVLVELGVVGGALLFTMMWKTLRAGWHFYRPRRPSAGTRTGTAPPHHPEVFASMLAFCVTATFLSHAYQHLTFFVIGLGALVAQVHRFEQSAGAPERN